MPPQVIQEQTEMQEPAVTEMPPPVAEMSPQVIQESENVQSPEMSGQEQVEESTSIQPVVAEEQKKEDTIKAALMKQLKEIEEKTAQIKNQLGGGIMKKRKKTFYKRYKSKKSMKRKNKTSRNN
jgi:hypothetical protein